jgi:hypothetical protein
VAVVLDPSAVVRFAHGDDVAVGELLGEVADEHAFAAVPVSAIALAHAKLSTPRQQSRLTLLADQNPSVVVLPMPAEEGRLIGQYTAELGQSLGLAHAVREAERNHAQLVTADGDVVRKAFGEIYGIVDL